MIASSLGLKSAVEDLAEYSAAICAKYFNKPLDWSVHMYPWGSDALPGFFVKEWQASILMEIEHAIELGHRKIFIDVCSGHGIGKSALIAMIGQWLICTRHTRGIITANTAGQLSTKTMPEFVKWANLCMASRWMQTSATSVRRNLEHAEDWRVDAIPWVKEKPDAFGGLHNANGAVLVVFDEASGIPKVIWETVDGALSGKERLAIWLRFGNPLRNVGMFAEIFKKEKPVGVYTIRRMIDSRDVEHMDVEFINARIAENGGEDSDYAKSRWRGVFPSQSDWQLISTKDVDAAMRRTAHQPSMYEPILAGIDFARAGRDKSVLRFRQGRDAKSLPSFRWNREIGRNSMDLAARIAQELQRVRPHYIFADEGGIGGPIIDRLGQLGWEVTPVNAAGESSDKDRWANKRAEMWCRMNDWLKGPVALEANQDLRANLIQQEFKFRGDSQVVILISKEEMREEGFPSPDEAEALAQTFAYPVAPLSDPRDSVGRKRTAWDLSDYDPLA